MVHRDTVDIMAKETKILKVKTENAKKRKRKSDRAREQRVNL